MGADVKVKMVKMLGPLARLTQKLMHVTMHYAASRTQAAPRAAQHSK
jgi:hypothetical protein